MDGRLPHGERRVASVAGRICWFQVAAETLEGAPNGSRYLIFE